LRNENTATRQPRQSRREAIGTPGAGTKTATHIAKKEGTQEIALT